MGRPGIPDPELVAQVDDPEPEAPEALSMPWRQVEQEVPEDLPVEADREHELHPPEPLAPTGDGKHVVQKGEDIGTIAAQYGWLPDALWGHDANKKLREARHDGYVLLPGDKVAIPEIEQRDEGAATSQGHTFRRKKVPLRLYVEVDAEDGSAYGKQPFTLDGPGWHQEGTTTDKGLVETWADPALKRATLTFPELGESMEVEIGSLMPEETVEGAQQRLNNLGYHCGAITGELNTQTVLQLRRFQADHKIKPKDDQVLDEATQKALVAEHGS
jgi:hypothetical protein